MWPLWGVWLSGSVCAVVILASLGVSVVDVKHIRFGHAQEFKMPFGKHKGRTIDEIAKTDEGLKYLDYMVGKLDEGAVKRVIEIYLRDPAIKEELDKL